VTDKVDVYYQLIKDQNLPTLAWDPKTKLLWGGTDRWGQMPQPRADPGELAHLRLRPTHAAGRGNAHARGRLGRDERARGIANGILVAESGSQIALIDTATARTARAPDVAGSVPSKVRLGADGMVPTACSTGSCIAGTWSRT